MPDAETINAVRTMGPWGALVLVAMIWAFVELRKAKKPNGTYMLKLEDEVKGQLRDIRRNTFSTVEQLDKIEDNTRDAAKALERMPGRP